MDVSYYIISREEHDFREENLVYKVATITFHHAHNYGSVLQAYALQEFIKKLAADEGVDLEYKIIDFYSKKQQELYRVFKSIQNPKNIIKNMIALPYSKKMQIKHDKFEHFLECYCNLSQRYTTKEELLNSYPDADCYISGSDQLWNVRALDFSPAYYYDFLPDSCKRVSYAASLGPLQIDWSKYDATGCKKLLSKYSALSVREKGSLDNIKSISDFSCNIHVDPTLLLTSEQWREIESNANYNDGQYILLYCLEPSKEQLKIANAISKKIKLPIVVLRYNNKNDIFNHFVKKYDSGPEDFLAYIDHAALVLSSSFHGTAFSLIYHKPFYSFNGMEDYRIASILKKTGMENRSLESIEDVKSVSLEEPDGKIIDQLLEVERQRSREYLRRALEIE